MVIHTPAATTQPARQRSGVPRFAAGARPRSQGTPNMTENIFAYVQRLRCTDGDAAWQLTSPRVWQSCDARCTWLAGATCAWAAVNTSMSLVVPTGTAVRVP